MHSGFASEAWPLSLLDDASGGLPWTKGGATGSSSKHKDDAFFGDISGGFSPEDAAPILPLEAPGSIGIAAGHSTDGLANAVRNNPEDACLIRGDGTAGAA